MIESHFRHDVKYFAKLEDRFKTYMSTYDVKRRHHLIFAILLNRLDLSGKQVLEVGCGTGVFSESIKTKGAELTVLDIGATLVRDVSQKLTCKGVVGDVCNLPFEDESFDAVISSECIEHTLDPLRAIRELCRVCRRGGHVCLTTPNKLWYPALLLYQKLGLRKFSGIENWIFPSQAKRAMKDSGIDKVRLRGCHLWPFQLKFTRPLLIFFDSHASWLYPFMINYGIVGYK
jgi:ubiquinone/menaquinone biosynthesis C-methylase UbiE